MAEFDEVPLSQALDFIYWHRVRGMGAEEREWFDEIVNRTQAEWDALAASRAAEAAERAAAQIALREKYRRGG